MINNLLYSRNIIWEMSQLSLTAVTFFKTEENVSPANFVTPKGVRGKMFLPIILWVMADGIAISGRCLNHFELIWTLGRCYCLNLG